MQGNDDKEFHIRNASRMRVGIVAARFNQAITGKLLAAAKEELNKFKVKEKNIAVLRVAGSIEIPFALQMLARTKKYDCLVALGAVIKGETPHFDYVCKIASEGVLRVMLDYHIPVGFGILTALHEGQAWARVKAAGHAVRAALELASLKKEKHDAPH